MDSKPDVDRQLENPRDVRGSDGTRSDGRPTDPQQPLENQRRSDGAPTEAPEDKGQQPTTEHAPGGDL